MLHVAPGILVYEKRPRWEPELKRQLAGSRVRVRGVRAEGAVVLLLRSMPGSVLVLDLDAGAADGLRLLAVVAELGVPAVSLVIASPATAGLEWPARELGALDFHPAAITGESLARQCLRAMYTPRGPS